MAFGRPLRVQYLHIHICIYAYMHILPPLTYALTNTSISSVSHLSLTLPCFQEPYMLFAVVNHRLNHYLQGGQQCVWGITFVLTVVCYFQAVYCIVLYCTVLCFSLLYSIVHPYTHDRNCHSKSSRRILLHIVGHVCYSVKGNGIAYIGISPRVPCTHNIYQRCCTLYSIILIKQV